MGRLLLIAALAACAPAEPKSSSGDDTDKVTVECDPEAEPSLVIGQGQGSEFTVLEDGDSVTLDVAPQGGFGVSVRAKTTGLSTEETVDVLLETELEGEESGSFVNQGTNLYCQDDGTGLLWGVVVGFDAESFPADALIDLNGEEALLIVEATDVSGQSARGEIMVTIEVGG